MKFRMILLMGVVSLGMLAYSAGTVQAKDAADTPKDKSTATNKSEKSSVKDSQEKDNSDSNTATQPSETKSETQPAKDDNEKSDADNTNEEKKEVPVIDGLEDFYAELAKSVEMPEEQQKKLLSIQDSVKKRIELQAKKDEREIEHLQKKISKSDEKDAKKYQKRLDAIQGKSKTIEKAGQQMALKTLKGQQIQKWNEALLWQIMEQDMNMLGVSGEQRTKAQTLCNEVVEKYKTKPLPEEAGEKLRIIAAKKLLKEVLDADQAKEYKRFLSEQMQNNQEKSGKASKNSR